MAPKKRDAPESAPDPETGETVHIGTEEELHWFDEADDDDDAELEELLKQLSEPAKDVGVPWWLPSGKPDREKRKLKQAIPLKGTADDPSILTPGRQTHVERLMARRAAKLDSTRSTQRQPKTRQPKLSLTDRNQRIYEAQHRLLQARNRVMATGASILEISSEEYDELASLERQKFAISLVSWYDYLLKEKDYYQEELQSRTVLQEAVDQRLIGEFRAAQATLNLTPEDAQTYFEGILAREFGAKEALQRYETGEEVAPPAKAPVLYKDREDAGKKPAPPTVAPVFYAERQNEDELPGTFLMRVYKPWAGSGLTRTAIGKLDPALLRALYRQGIPPEVDDMFPKSAGRPKTKRSKTEEAEALEKKRDAGRDRAKRFRERQRQLRK